MSASFLPPWVMFQPNRRLLNINRVMAWNIMRRSPRLALMRYGNYSEQGSTASVSMLWVSDQEHRLGSSVQNNPTAGHSSRIHYQIFTHIDVLTPWIPAPPLDIKSRLHRCWWRGLWQHVQYWIRLETYVLITQYRCVDSTGRTGDKRQYVV